MVVFRNVESTHTMAALASHLATRLPVFPLPNTRKSMVNLEKTVNSGQ